MGEMQVIEIKGMRVLTTKQLAEMYETSQEKIRWNFKYNREKYTEGKHFVLVEGEELKRLKRECEFQTLLKQAKSVCFWTEKGALLHAKSLNTDKAWEVYDYLVDFYFRVKEAPRQQVSEQPKPLMAAVVDVPDNERIHRAMEKVRNDMKAIEAILTLCDKYQKEDEYQSEVQVLNKLGFQLYDDIFTLKSMKPG